MDTNEQAKEQATQEQEQSEKPSIVGGLKGIGFGLLVFGLAYYFFTTMTKYESGESVRMNSILLIIYKIAGKNIATGIIAVIGTLATLGGVSEILKSRK